MEVSQWVKMKVINLCLFKVIFYLLSCDENHYVSPFGRNILYFFQPLNKQIKAWEEDFLG